MLRPRKSDIKLHITPTDRTIYPGSVALFGDGKECPGEIARETERSVKPSFWLTKSEENTICVPTNGT